MKEVINLYKPIGLTPLQVIERFRKEYPEYKDVKIAYAGRLDPMAHGVLILLIGDECKQRDKYQGLDKEYEFQALFGIESDTYDVLGIPSSTLKNEYPQNFSAQVKSQKSKVKGQQNQPYPPYSSKTVQGKPLYWWARQGRLDEIEIPRKKVTIYDIKLLGSKQLTASSINKNIIKRINMVDGDFRQEEILKAWKTLVSKIPDSSFQILSFSATVSSGTYIRSIISDFGKKLGTGAIAFDILRNKVGEYDLEDSLKLKYLSY